MMRRWLLAGVVLLTMSLRVSAQDIPLSKILVDKEGWRALAKELPRITFLEADPNGSVVIYQGARSVRLAADGKVEKIPPPPRFMPLRYQTLVTTRAGAGYDIDVEGKAVRATVGEKRETLKLPGLIAPTCLTAWPDDGHLVIGEADGAYLWAVRIETDGRLGPGDRYYSLRTKPGEKMHVTALTMDAAFLLYAATPLGIQVFDPTGRLSGVIAAPAKESMTALAIGGAQADTLFVAGGAKIYGRKIQGRAAYTLKKAK